MSNYLTREQILGKDDLKTEEVFVEAWSGTVLVSEMSGTSRDIFEKELAESDNIMTNIRAKLVSRSIVDENGNRVFTDKDIEALGKKSGEALTILFSVAKRLSAIGEQEVNDVIKNSESDLADDSILE